ncbi:bifunctional DNA primase/polymerase [Streptosporangium sp. NPDC023963]|uniref:bifunctional DNA primase/polymerase n=1 Tax=Streptosporangium sp. NPDC023963 TaxID=3155608 RepID=UPI00342734B3
MTGMLYDTSTWTAVQWLAHRFNFKMATADHPANPECVGAHYPDRPCDDQRGKHPVGRWPLVATNNLAGLRAQFGRGPRNILLPAGLNNLLIVDEDRQGAFTEYAASVGQTIDPTFTVATAKGRHFYYWQPEGEQLGNSPGALKGLGIDIRGKGGYVIGPGSVHETGVIYTPVDSSTPILPAPEWLVEVLRPKRSPVSARRTSGQGQSIPGVAGLASWLSRQQEGNRNRSLHWACCRAAEQDLGDAAFDELVRVAMSIGLPEDASRRTVASARRTVARRNA